MPENEPVTKPSLVRKLAEVMAAVGWIEKSGYNEFHKYKYAQEADLVSALRGELAERNVMIFPDVKTYERKPLEVETLKWDDVAKAKVPVVRKTQLAEILVDWTFVDGDSGEFRTISIPGVGEDNVDKGFYKAFTGSEKYMLMKTFLIPTGDDPEKDNAEERETAKQEGLSSAKALGQAKVAKLREKVAPAASNVVPSLFWVELPSGMYEINGDEVLKKLNRDVLKNFYSKVAQAIVVTGEQLEDLKYTLEQRKTPFSALPKAQP